MEIVHKAVLFAVMTFVIVGGAISLAGPQGTSAIMGKMESQDATDDTAISAADNELLATEVSVSSNKSGT